MKRSLALFLAALSLAACQAPASPDPAPPVPENTPARETSPAPEPAPLEIISAADGLEYRILLTWSPPYQKDLLDLLLTAPGKLLVRREDRFGATHTNTLLGLDLDTGRQVFSLDLTKYGTEYHIRPVFTAPGMFRIDTKDTFLQVAWGGETVAEYTLPSSVRLGQGSCYGWDALPEADRLAWTDETGLWLARADGSDPVLALPGGAIHEQEAFANIAKKHRAAGSLLAFWQPYLMGGGRYIAAPFGSASFQGHSEGLAVLDTETGEVLWGEGSFLYGVADGPELLSDTALLVGATLVDVAAGEISRAYQQEQIDRFKALSQDFFRSFRVEETGAEYRLLSCAVEGWRSARPLLVLPKHQDAVFDGAYERFLVLVAEEDRVVCCYQRLDEVGLLLVNVPEPSAPKLLPAEGVLCQPVHSWPTQDKDWSSTFLAPQNGLVLVGLTRRDQNYQVTDSQLLGVDMNLGEVAFTMPLTWENDIREVLTDPGGESMRFILADGAGYTCYIWGKGSGALEQYSYTLPPAIAKAVADWAAADTSVRLPQGGWDARWPDSIVTWLTEEGVWVAAADGSDARMVISTQEICQRPEYADYLECAQMLSDTYRETKDCLYLSDPRLMNGGNTLVLPIRNRVSPYWSNDLLTIDLTTGERTWYDNVMLDRNQNDIWYRDDTTILAGWSFMVEESITRIDLTDGSARKLEGWTPDLLMTLGNTSDGRTFFSADIQEGTIQLLTVEDFGPQPAMEDRNQAVQQLWDQRQTLLTIQGDCRIDQLLAVDGNRLLFTYIAGEDTKQPTTHLAVVTAPEV